MFHVWKVGPASGTPRATETKRDVATRSSEALSRRSRTPRTVDSLRSLWASEPLGDLRLGHSGVLGFNGICQHYYYSSDSYYLCYLLLFSYLFLISFYFLMFICVYEYFFLFLIYSFFLFGIGGGGPYEFGGAAYGTTRERRRTVQIRGGNRPYKFGEVVDRANSASCRTGQIR